MKILNSVHCFDIAIKSIIICYVSYSWRHLWVAFLMFLRIMPMHMQWSFDVIFASSRGCIWSWKYVCKFKWLRPQTLAAGKDLYQVYRKHWKSYIRFQLSGQTGPFCAVLKKKIGQKIGPIMINFWGRFLHVFRGKKNSKFWNILNRLH